MLTTMKGSLHSVIKSLSSLIFIVLLSCCYYCDASTFTTSTTATASNTNNNIYPQCASMAFTSSGQLDTAAILYNCSANIPGNTEPPSTYPNRTGGYSPTIVNVQLSLNNLISVDDIASRLTIDFFYRLKWYDPRWNLPSELWDYVNPYIITSDGLSILGYVYAQNELEVWKPDITFQQMVEMDVISESFKLFPDGIFYWSRHVVATFVEPSMAYNNYPQDSQNFSLVIQSYAYSSYFIDVHFINNEPVTYVDNFQSTDSSTTTNLEQNQIWQYEGFTAYLQKVLQPNFANPGRTFSMAFINLIFKRQSSGIVVRFILPLTLLLLLTGLTFWITFENRVDTTITILVSASALYIVILQNVPNVGYLTDADKFIFWMFLLLVAVVSMHQVYATLQEKVERWPLRLIILRMIETSGRVFVPCMIIFYFQTTIKYFEDIRPVTTAFTITVATILFFREAFGIRNAYELAIEGLYKKVNNESCTISEISKVECFVLNRLLFKKFSLSIHDIAKEMRNKHHLGCESEKARSVYLRNYDQMDELVSGGNANGTGSGAANLSSNSTGSSHGGRGSMASVLNKTLNKHLERESRDSILYPSNGVELSSMHTSNHNPMQHSQSNTSIDADPLAVYRPSFTHFKRTTIPSVGTNMMTDVETPHQQQDQSKRSSFNPRVSEMEDSDDE